MSPSSATLRQYESIAALTSRMLEQARAGTWDEVLALGSQYQAAVEALRDMNPLSKDEQLAQRDLLVRILDDDANIRRLASPELSRLGKLLGDIRRQHTVLQAYCAPSLKQ
ncbi:flagellar protein FliT [Pollutimonas harenae]|uniref:Flagellar protein FliT n=1 Tax=Pollutimonas harenae TaxID=657015 RepID=A0A853GV95_9BURK|nr:flagellar protein FliT [Pollutimonas harenae]NYT86231.1 flagellar protein FliT [Pollutimonas harenae]TEA71262.1 flagellar protein FliT [Pollutimonas harenae]